LVRLKRKKRNGKSRKGEQTEEKARTRDQTPQHLKKCLERKSSDSPALRRKGGQKKMTGNFRFRGSTKKEKRDRAEGGPMEKERAINSK